MSLQEVFKFPFELVDTLTCCCTTNFYFRTEDMEGETTMEEIYNRYKTYFDNIVERYKNYCLGESEFTLYVGFTEEYDREGRIVAELVFNSITQQIELEDKYKENIPVKGKFFLALDVEINLN